MSAHPLETYLKALRDIRATGSAVPETSYYPALSNLLNELGKTLKPKVLCVLHVQNRGAGIPDGGLFTPDQLQRGTGEPDKGTLPARGVIEVKPTKDDAFVTADGKQVSQYWGRYRQVLVTNYRDFVLVTQGPDGAIAKGESYRLADSEKAFWEEAAHPRAVVARHGVAFVEYLKRVLLHAAPLADPKDVAWFLASYAKHALARIEHSELKALEGVRKGLEEALGVRFEGAKGDHFFKSTFVQTLYYGIFSAWVLWSKEHGAPGALARGVQDTTSAGGGARSSHDPSHNSRAPGALARGVQDTTSAGGGARSSSDRTRNSKNKPYVYKRNLPHIQSTQSTYFITFCTKDRIAIPPQARAWVLESCLHEHGKRAILHTAVVMPDHVHLLLTPIEQEPGIPFHLADILQAIKSVTSHRINKALRRKGAFWQEESFDRYLRNEESIQEKADYICSNPVRKELVRSPDDWPWLWRAWIEGEGIAGRELPAGGGARRSHDPSHDSQAPGALARREQDTTSAGGGARRSSSNHSGRKPFNWHEAAWTLRVPMIRALFDQVATPSKLGPLGLVEPLDWAGAALNRVDPIFFERFEEGHAVQYFYEPFLEAFDPELRKELGVWYTPPEIVRYMVARVDTVLREELDLPDGLADKRVFVLDPCCGTGAYLVEVVRKIAETLKAKGGDDLAGQDLKQAATKRVFGFEILPAPFVVAHLQMGLLLRTQGAPLSDKKNERAGIYLTNALTGWKPPKDPKTKLLFPEMEEEREAADNLKQHVPILVILGNPPYNGYAGLAVAEERELSESYRTTVKAAKPQGQGLNDLYVRFFRMAERRIVEMNQPAKGVVCFISNYSWLDGLSFTGMRERYLDAFDKVWVDCLNGDKYKTGKLTPEGEPDPSVFSTDFNREGIQVGTAVALLVRKDSAGVGARRSQTGAPDAPVRGRRSRTGAPDAPVRGRRSRTGAPDAPVRGRDASNSAGGAPAAPTMPAAAIRFRHFWGKAKLAQLEAAAKTVKQKGYEAVAPELPMGLPFMPSKSEAGYFKWPLLPDLFPTSFPGVKTSRDDFLVDIDRERLLQRIKRYFDPKEGNEELERACPGLMQDSGQYKAKEAREFLVKRGMESGKVVRYCYRPFDVRWLYWEPDSFLLDRKREEYFPHVFEGNLWISAGQRNRKEDFYQPQVTGFLADHHIVESNVAMFPNLLSGPHLKSDDLFSGPPKTGKVPNLSDEAAAYLDNLKAAGPEPLFFHALAVLHAPGYREENGGALRQDWPRVPLPAAKKALEASAALGRELAALLDPETPAPGVSAGTIRPEMKVLGVASRVGKGRLDPDAGHLALTVGWGHAGQGGVCMPGRGKTEAREYTKEEHEALEQRAPSPAEARHSPGEGARGSKGSEFVYDCLGKTTLDVYLNGDAYWRNVPEKVWEYTLGGYQVVKKWLSYREKTMLGRDLTADEVRYVSEMVRRIAAILLLGPALDGNYEKVKGDTVDWAALKE